MKSILENKKKYFILSILSAVITLIIFVLILVLPLGDYKLLYLIILLIVGVGFMNNYKSNLDYFIFLEQRELILKTPFKPSKVNVPILSESWLNKITKKGYILLENQNGISFYYKIDTITINNKTQKVLNLLILLNNYEVNFNNENVLNKVEIIVKKIRKKNRFLHRNLIYLKKFSESNTPNIKATKQIFWLKKGRTSTVSLNVSYFTKEKIVYYVDNTYNSPNIYFKEAVEQIKKIV